MTRQTQATEGQDGPPHSSEELAVTAAEQRRMATVALALTALALLAYTSPQLAGVQAWAPGEGIPIARMFTSGVTALPSFAEAGLLSSAAVSEAELAHTLGAAVARNMAPARSDAPTDTGPTAAPGVHIAPSEYEGITQDIEYADALRPFFERLEATAKREAGAITRVAHYGDSSVAADQITATTRRHLQRRFGDAGHGFVLISRGDMHYAHKDVVHRTSSGWQTFSAVRSGLGTDAYGYGGVQTRGGAGEHATFSTSKDTPVGGRVARFEVFYQRYRGGGRVLVSIDGQAREPIVTHHERQEDGFASYEVPDGEHALRLRPSGGGAVRLYGVAMERNTPGVVYDSLGLVGARAQRLLNLKPAHIKGQIAHRSPDLLVLGFGGNEAGNAWLNMQAYEQEVQDVIRHMRAGKREMACLLVGPLDQAEVGPRGQIVTIAKLPEIVEVQRRVAKREGCAFFDTFAAMGGEGSMATWRKSRPRLATSDLRHATPQGYDVIANMYYKALLKAFAGYLAR